MAVGDSSFLHTWWSTDWWEVTEQSSKKRKKRPRRQKGGGWRWRWYEGTKSRGWGKRSTMRQSETAPTCFPNHRLRLQKAAWHRHLLRLAGTLDCYLDLANLEKSPFSTLTGLWLPELSEFQATRMEILSLIILSLFDIQVLYDSIWIRHCWKNSWILLTNLLLWSSLIRC